MLAQHYTCQPISAKQNLFFNFKYYLTCVYVIIRSILTKKVSNCVWLIIDGHTYLINERKKKNYYIKYISYG